MRRPRDAAQIVRHRVLTLWVACWLTVLAAPVAAWPSGAEEEPGPETADQTPRIAAPLKVAVDRETGELAAVPSSGRTTVLSAAVADALSRSTDGLRVFELANGGLGVDLQGRFQHVVLVRVMPDGSLEASCVDDANAANELMGHGSAKADPEPEEE